MENIESKFKNLFNFIKWFIALQVTIGLGVGGFIVNMNSRIIQNKSDIRNNQEMRIHDSDRISALENNNINSIKVNIIMAKQELLSAQLNKDRQAIYEAKKEIEKYQKQLITANQNGQTFRGAK